MVLPKKCDKESTDHYKQISNSTSKVVGKFFAKINDGNFYQLCQSVCIEYIEDYWKLFVKFKTYKMVSRQKQHVGYCCSKASW